MRLPQWVAVMLGLALMTVLATGSSAAQQQPAPGTGGLQIVEHGSSAGPAGTINLVIQLPGVIAVGDNLTLTIHDPVTDESAFLATTQGDELGGILDSRTFDVDALDPDLFGLVDIIIDLNPQDGTLPLEEGQFRLVRSGVYPVSLELRTGEQELIGRLITHIIRLPDATQEDPGLVQLPVVVVADARQDDGDPLDLLRVFGERPDAVATAAITPELFINESGAAEVQAFLAADGHQQLTRAPLFPVDEGDLFGQGFDTELADLLQSGDNALQITGAAAPPTLWIDDGAVSNDLLEALYARGVRDVILHRDSLDPGPSLPPRRPVEIDTGDLQLRALVIDDLAPLQPGDTPASAAQRTAAHLATIALTESDTGVVTIDLTGSGWEHGAALLDELLRLPLILLVPASEAVGGELAVDTAGRPLRYDITDRAGPLRSYAGYHVAKSHLAAYRSMVRDEDAGEHDRLAAELHRSLQAQLSDTERDTVWQQATDLVLQQSSLLDAPPVDSINLTSRQAVVPFSFQNRSDTTFRVEVRFISEKLRVEDFDDGESTTLLLEPGITTREFSLRSLSTGTFPVTIELHSPDGQLLISQTRAAIRSTTPTGVGLGLTAGAALFLLGWWVLDLRRRRMS